MVDFLKLSINDKCQNMSFELSLCRCRHIAVIHLLHELPGAEAVLAPAGPELLLVPVTYTEKYHEFEANISLFFLFSF